VMGGRVCGEKRDYDSKAAAKRALRRLQGLPGGVALRRVYRCERCGRWHLTSSGKRAAGGGDERAVA
jgi:hypothetical protein